MTKMIYCSCPKCQKRVHNWLHDNPKKTRKMRCYECGISFTIEVKDFEQK